MGQEVDFTTLEKVSGSYVSSVLSALEIPFGQAPLAVQEAVSRIVDLAQLRALLRQAILAASLEEFAASLSGAGNGHHGS